MAVSYDGELVDFRVRTFYEAWTAQKQADMIEVILNAIERYEIARIVVKSPKPAHCSENIQRLMSDIQRLTDGKGIQLATCTITALKQRYTSAGRGNKQELVEAIVRKYPEQRKLAAIGARKQAHRSLGRIKMFEAIACLEIV